MREPKRVPFLRVPGGLFDRMLGDRVETNIRVVAGPEKGGLTVHRLAVRSGRQHADLRQAVCSGLRRRHKIVAIPSPFEENEVLAAVALPTEAIRVTGAKYDAEVRALGERIELGYDRSTDLDAIEELIERSIALEFEGSGNYWRTGQSARIWYCENPAQSHGDLEAILRVAFAAVTLPGGRVGVACEAGYLYRMKHTIAEVFDPSLPENVRTARIGRFDRLRGKGGGRSGSLLYDTGGSVVQTCFFDRLVPGMTCDSTGPIMGEMSLYHYVRAKYRRLAVSGSDLVAYVSFEGLPNVAVPAKCLRLRLSVDGNTLPNAMRKATSLSPARRRELADEAWTAECRAAMRRLGLDDKGGLWAPGVNERELVKGPTLVFAKGRRIAPPGSATLDEYKRYFRERMRQLHKGGMLRVEPSVERRYAIVTPSGNDGLQKRFVDDMAAAVEDFTGVGFKVVTVKATEIDDIVAQVQAAQVDAAVIVFDSRAHDDASYFILSHELTKVRIKRLTRQVVESKYQALLDARSDDERRSAENEWRSMIELSALKFLDQFVGTAWAVEPLGYDAILSIDVGQNRRHWAVSLLISPPGASHPLRLTVPWHKGDVQREEINADILFDKLAKLFAEFLPGKRPPLNSLLVLRDGRFCGGEEAAVKRAIELWRQREWLASGAHVDLVEVHKKSMKGIRLWYDDRDGVGNVLEGEAVYLGNAIILCCTGAATLSRHVTASPGILVCRPGTDKRRVAGAYFAAAQLNFHNPTKAHRLAQPLRETDAELRHRVAMDTRGIR